MGCILFLYLAKINLRVKVNGAEYIAELAAVVFLNVRQSDVDLLANFVVVTVFIKEFKGRLFIDGKVRSFSVVSRSLNALIISKSMAWE